MFLVETWDRMQTFFDIVEWFIIFSKEKSRQTIIETNRCEDKMHCIRRDFVTIQKYMDRIYLNERTYLSEKT